MINHIEEIFKDQLSFQKLIKQPTSFINDNNRARAANIQLRRAQDELAEALREIPYDLSNFGLKSKISSFPKDRVKDELADTFLFMVNVMNILEIDPYAFLTHCRMKQAINMNRFKDKKRFIYQPDNFLIVIEGADGIGKTEICNELATRLGYPIMRMPDRTIYPKDISDIEHYSTFYRKVIQDAPGVLILDRFYPSSMVYGEFFGRTMDTSDLEMLHEKRDVFVFIIDSDKPFRGDTLIDDVEWLQIRKLYLEKANQYEWTVIKNNTSLENCVNEIVEKLQF